MTCPARIQKGEPGVRTPLIFQGMGFAMVKTLSDPSWDEGGTPTPLRNFSGSVNACADTVKKIMKKSEQFFFLVIFFFKNGQKTCTHFS